MGVSSTVRAGWHTLPLTMGNLWILGNISLCLLFRLPGWDKHSYGYHGDDGHSFCSSGQGQAYGPTFTTGDVIGTNFLFIVGVDEFKAGGLPLIMKWKSGACKKGESNDHLPHWQNKGCIPPPQFQDNRGVYFPEYYTPGWKMGWKMKHMKSQ